LRVPYSLEKSLSITYARRGVVQSGSGETMVCPKFPFRLTISGPTMLGHGWILGHYHVGHEASERSAIRNPEFSALSSSQERLDFPFRFEPIGPPISVGRNFCLREFKTGK